VLIPPVRIKAPRCNWRGPVILLLLGWWTNRRRGPMLEWY
jgi:hypothetical protein